MRRTTALVIGMFVLLIGSHGRAATPEASLSSCQTTVGTEGVRYENLLHKGLNACLKRIAIELIGKQKANASGAASTCNRQFARIPSFRSKLAAKMAQRCDPSSPAVSHVLGDVLGPIPIAVGGQTIDARNIDTWCQSFGGDGSIDSVGEWTDCVRRSHDVSVVVDASTEHPRLLEWLADVKQFLPAGDEKDILEDLESTIEGSTDDNRPENPIGPGGTAGGFPATGQTSCWNTGGTFIPCAGTGLDGDLQAGASLAYSDNGDGTISDLNTALMWEKKSNDGSIHDVDNIYTLDQAIADHVGTLNGTAFAGHSDWRVPNVKELQSLIDYQRHDPSIDPIFDTGCVNGCAVLTCSCTGLSVHHSTTTILSSTSEIWAVRFDNANVGNHGKSQFAYVRAVRGGS